MQRLPIQDFLKVSKERYLFQRSVYFFVCLYVASGLVWIGVFELRYFGSLALAGSVNE